MQTFIQPIDPHVHLRGEEHPKDFLRLGLQHAAAAGLCAVMEQPNPVPQLTTTEIIAQRNEKAKQILKEESLPVAHFCHIGLTLDAHQARRAFEAAAANQAKIRAVKIFWTNSTGNMGLINPEYQKYIWKVAAECGYQGPVIQHCEDETEFIWNFNPEDPQTHSLRQSPKAEYVQVERQLQNAHDAGFSGIFYIAHVSNPATVDLVREFTSKPRSMRIVMEACWHHILLNTDDYRVQGNNVKMNPPLRTPELQEKMLAHVLEGNIQILGKDHAPHMPKDPVKPASGIPGIPFWPKGIEILRRYGINQGLLDDLTFHKANQIFRLGLEPKTCQREYQPELWKEYNFNPFQRIDA